MCSILFTNKETEASKYKLLKLRGPDGTTEKNISGYNFVHNLLSLTGEYTEQPVVEDKIAVLFNGEIYNYKELDPKAQSDSYSIITAYKKYGPKFVQYLDGEYAIVLIDYNKQIILFSSDIFRTKPLFYSLEDGNIGLSTFRTPLEKLEFNFLSEAKAKRLVRAYGLNAWDLLKGAVNLEDLGEQFGEFLTQREVEYLRENEFVMEADDIIWRRTKLGLIMSEHDKKRLSEYLKTS